MNNESGARRAFFCYERGPSGKVTSAVYYDERPAKPSPDKLNPVLEGTIVEIDGGTANTRFFKPDGGAFMHALELTYPQPAFE